MRALAAAIGLGIAIASGGCRCGDDAPARPPPPVSAAVPSPTTTAASEPLSTERRAEWLHLLHAARALEAAGSSEGALARLDEALVLVPADPRVLCESGLVAHHAGRDALAAERIDAALALFGPPERIPTSQRVALARCAFARGEVDEALGDSVAAVEHYGIAITLRAEDTAERRRVAAMAMAATADGEDSMGGVRGALRRGGLLVRTTDRAELERAMRTGFAGRDERAGTTLEASETEITVLAEQPTGDGARPAVAYRIVAPGEPLARADGVLALPADDGWLLVVVVEGGEEEDDGYWRNEPERARFGTLGRYLRLDVDGHESPSASETRAYTTSALCEMGAAPRCVVVPDGEPATLPIDFDALHETAAPPYGLTDREHDAMAAEPAEDEGE